jgi:isoprenylcysteine carboxyl methyltransferase (ICMT) family protein YpbQ
VSALGLIVRIITVGYTPANTSGRNTANQVADTVNQLGIYSTVRHPLYVGNFLMYLGLAMLTHNIWFVIIYILVFYLYYERIMFAEEQFLRKKFGTQYTEWASKTPAFWPRFSQFKKADLYFSWRKILKKEKNGLAAMFALFYIFFLLRNYIINGKIDFNLSFWMVSTILSLVLYLILKYLKYNSNILNEEGR